LISIAFETHDIESLYRISIENLFIKLSPQLIYVIIPTCNRFYYNQVVDQWEVIKRFHKKLLEILVGPLCKYASDEDVRR